jgi:cell division septation protein DedD
MKKSLLQLIAEADDKAEDKPKKKFTVTVTDADGNEVQKTAMAYNIGDIKAYWASGARPDETFVKADLHDDEVDAAPTDELPADDTAPTDELPNDEAPADDADDELPPDDEAPADEEELDDEDAPKKKPKSDDPMAVDEFKMLRFATKPVITEMAKRTSPADFYKMVVAVHGAKGAESVSWADIKAVADKNDVLIPVYIRDQKVARGRWTAKPKDMKAPAHEPTIEKKPVAAAPKEVAKAAHAAVKDEKPAEMQYKEVYKKEDFPDVEFAWTTTYHSGNDLLAAIEKHHGVKPDDTKRVVVGTRDNYYIVKKGTLDVLGRVTFTGGGLRPGYGRTGSG